MVAAIEVFTVAELQEAFLSGTKYRIAGNDSHREFRVPVEAAELRVRFSRILDIVPEDQVVTCAANTPLAELQHALRAVGQCLPYLPWQGTSNGALHDVSGTAAGHISMNLPHAFEASCGTWRDWLLGAKVFLPGFGSASCGSRAVKNVAGYDVHRLLVGARGCLAVFTELIIRTFPVKALPEPDLITMQTGRPAQGWIQRTGRSDFERVVSGSGSRVLALHPETCTAYVQGNDAESPTRSGHDWKVGWGFGSENLEPMRGAAALYCAKAKQLFDPAGQLNPGELRML